MSPAGHEAVPYPGSWSRLSEEVIDGHPYCAACGAQRGEVTGWQGSRPVVVRLTVHHRNGDTRDLARPNLVVLCDACHGSLTSGGWLRR